MRTSISLMTVILLSWCTTTEADDTLRRIAVYNIKSEVLPDEFTETLTDQIESRLIRFPGYRVISRSNLDVLITEDNLSQSGITGSDDIRLVQTGPRSSVDKICTGSITRIGRSYSFTLKIIDVGTARIDAAAQKLYSGPAEGLLTIGSALLERIIPANIDTPKTLTTASIPPERNNGTIPIGMKSVDTTSTTTGKEVRTTQVSVPRPVAATGTDSPDTAAAISHGTPTVRRTSELGKKISIGAVVIFGTLAALVLFTRNQQ